MITAFDTDVLIYAAADHPLGRKVAQLFEGSSGEVGRIGSVLLLPEVLIKPLRTAAFQTETERLFGLLSRLRLISFDQQTAALAVSLAVKYGLKSLDAAHLATAVVGGADRFLTNNSKDFTQTVAEIDIVYPDQL